jgi:hypothetical protein
MKFSACVVFGLIVGATAYTQVTKVTPVQKVLQMMGEMKVTAEKMKEGEAATFREYTNWADDQKTELGFEIKTGKSEVEKLEATISAADRDVKKYTKEITAMNGEIDRMEKEMKDATTLRNTESNLFTNTQEDLAESVDAIARAQVVVKDGAQDKEQAVMLLQQMATTVPKMPIVLAAFLEEEELGAPKAAAYESQSDGIMSMLKGLQKKFKKELDECELEETNKRNAYELELQHLSDTVKATKTDLAEKEAMKGKTAAAFAKANGELVQTKNELESDEKMLVEVKSTYQTKKALFDGNQKTRTEELAAMSKAIEIISSPAVSESYSKKINLAQVTSLLQMSSQRRVAARQQLSTFLEKRATLLSSSTLKRLASDVAESPFGKVTGLIEGLITKLKEEASSEASHKGFCDGELKTNKLSRETQGTKVEQLSASTEKLAGEIDTMSKEISTLLSEQSALTEAQSKATTIRLDEKTKNEQTTKDFCLLCSLGLANHKALDSASLSLLCWFSSKS